VELFVRTLHGTRFSIFIDVTTESIEEVKRMIHYYEDTPLDQQRLIFDGRQLEEMRLLSDYDIEKGDEIHLVLRLRGG
ncbi:putative ubiquitin C variant 1, partial [Circinella umbellata]